MSNKINFTHTRLLAIEPPEKRSEYYDSGQKGLSLRVTPKGAKTFRLDVWDAHKKRHVKETLGGFPSLTVVQARKIVAKRIVELSEGIDIGERKKRLKAELTLDEIFETWLEDYAKHHIARWDQEEGRYKNHIQQELGHLKASEITKDRVEMWMKNASKKKRFDGKSSKTLDLHYVDRLLNTLSSIFTHTPHINNPCHGIARQKAKKRTVFLTAPMLTAFFKAIDSEKTSPLLRDYLLISLYTGARRNNVLSMEWHSVDFVNEIWVISGDDTKTKEPVTIPLIPQAISILKQRKGNDSKFVFPSPSSRSSTGYYADPKKAFKGLLERAGLPRDIRLHDIRRTMGSWQAITGASTKIIGQSLGHNSSRTADFFYAHLITDPVRAAMVKAAEKMNEQRMSEDE